MGYMEGSVPKLRTRIEGISQRSRTVSGLVGGNAFGSSWLRRDGIRQDDPSDALFLSFLPRPPVAPWGNVP